MKKIIRLTESDLARIVRRVIAEESQSTPNVPLESLTFSIMDSKVQNLYKSHSIYGKEADISLTQTLFDQYEPVVLRIGGGFVGTNAIIKTDTGDKKLTVTKDPFSAVLNVSDITQENKLQVEQIIITGANVDGGTLIVNLNFSDSSIAPKPTNESYRRRYRRY